MKHNEKMILTLLGSSHALSHGYLLILPAVLPLLLQQFSMGYFEIGVMGNIMILAYGLGALPAGILYNYFGPKRLYLFCFLGSAGASLLVAFSPNFLFFALGLTFLGALGSIYHPLANSLITHKVQDYGRALGVHGAAGNIGIGLTPFVAGLIASSWGWQYPYLCFAILGVFFSVWSLFVDISFKEEKIQKPPIALLLKPGKDKLMLFFSLPLVLVYLINMLNAFCYHGTITFLPTYIAQRTPSQILSFNSIAIGGMLSGIVLSVGVFGQYIGGELGQKPNLQRNLLWVSILALPSLLMMSFATQFSLLIMSLIYFCSNFCLQPMNNVLLTHYTTIEMRGTAFGIFFFIASAIGSFAASFAGYIAQVFGLHWVFFALSVIVTIQICCSFCLFKIKNNRK